MKSPIRVLVVISNLGFGGAERQVVELANHIDQTLIDFHLCTFSKHMPLAEHLRSSCKLHVLEKTGKFDFYLVLRLARLLKQLNIQVVHGFLFDSEIASRFAGAIAGTPLIIASERNCNHNYKKIQYWMYKLTKNMMHLCIANSNAGAEFNRITFNQPRSIYRVVRNGVDSMRFSINNHLTLKQDLGIRDEQVVVGIFGSFKRQKNHSFFFKAMKIVTERHDVKILVVGAKIQEGSEPTDEYEASLNALLMKLDLMQYCIFTGARNDVEKYYNVCDFTVLPSLFEGTPNVALESMACGKPVIATNVSDNANVIPDAKAGYIVPLDNVEVLAEKITTLVVNNSIRSEMSLFARRWIEENFSLEVMASNMAKIYLEVEK